ncbi:hypothetical protein LCGC14_1895690 [marine sediment metagenome]|uniref:Uncharacterized protein n=1 Tax=marine sediment metagenome TaxID=412755 RepID=A0A0F9FY54_9ZZZZ
MKLSKLVLLLERNLESQPKLKDLETTGLEVIRQGGTEYVGVKCRVTKEAEAKIKEAMLSDYGPEG